LQPGSRQPIAEHLTAQHPTAEHPTAEHPTAEQAVDDSTTERHVVVPSAAGQTISGMPNPEKPEEEQSAHQHPAAASPAAMPQLSAPPIAVPQIAAPPITARLPFTDRQLAGSPTPKHVPSQVHVETAREVLAPQQPAPSPRAASTYRPDSYLPPSVRIVADDPHVAIAPSAEGEPRVDPPAVEKGPTSARLPWDTEALELPKISYPEITPAEEPVAESTGRPPRRRLGQVAVAVLVLAAGGYLAKSFYSPVRQTASTAESTSTPAATSASTSAPVAALADRPALPAEPDARGAAASAELAAKRPLVTPAAVGSAPSPGRSAPITPPAPASSGFAAALEPRAITSGPAPRLPSSPSDAVPPTPAEGATADSTAGAIVPAPAEMTIDVPVLPRGLPLVPAAARNDSAMKRILRAVTSGKDSKRP
jgi:hypothetical protein